MYFTAIKKKLMVAVARVITVNADRRCRMLGLL